MLIPDQNKYMKEVEKVKDETVRVALEDIYEHLLGKKKINNIKRVVRSVLNGLFTVGEYNTDILIPGPFLDSTLGKVLFSILYADDDKLYTVMDICNLSRELGGGKPLGKQLVHYDMKQDPPLLKGTFKSNRWVFEESAVMDYLEKKGFQIKN